MSNLVTSILNGTQGLSDTELIKIAKDVGYELLTDIESASDVGRAIKKHGPLFAFGSAETTRNFLVGVKGNKVKVLNAASGAFELVRFRDLSEAGSSLKFFGGNLLGNSAEGAFSELHTIRDGVGLYHANHFIAFFRAPSVTDEFKQIFMRKLTEVFNRENIATLESTMYSHSGRPVFKFSIDNPQGFSLTDFGGWHHHDYVRLNQGSSENMWVTTLKREWRYSNEKLLSWWTAIPIYGPYYTGSLAINWHINSRHFLAGRRSWKIWNAGGDLWVIETPAIERYSHSFYSTLADIGVISRQQVIDIWTSFINNIAAMHGLTLIDDPAGEFSSYSFEAKSQGRVYYQDLSEPSPGLLRNNLRFNEALARHPELYPDR